MKQKWNPQPAPPAETTPRRVRPDHTVEVEKMVVPFLYVQSPGSVYPLDPKFTAKVKERFGA